MQEQFENGPAVALMAQSVTRSVDTTIVDSAVFHMNSGIFQLDVNLPEYLTVRPLVVPSSSSCTW